MGTGSREDGAGNPDRVLTGDQHRQQHVREQEFRRIIKQGLAKIGIKADYELIEFGDLVSRLTSSYDWEATIVGFSDGPDPHSGIDFWHSSETSTCGIRTSPSRRQSGKPILTSFMSEASQELDRAKRVSSLPQRPGNCGRERAGHLHDTFRTAEPRCATSSATPHPRCTGFGTSATCIERINSAVAVRPSLGSAKRIAAAGVWRRD